MRFQLILTTLLASSGALSFSPPTTKETARTFVKPSEKGEEAAVNESMKRFSNNAELDGKSPDELHDDTTVSNVKSTSKTLFQLKKNLAIALKTQKEAEYTSNAKIASMQHLLNYYKTTLEGHTQNTPHSISDSFHNKYAKLSYELKEERRDALKRNLVATENVAIAQKEFEKKAREASTAVDKKRTYAQVVKSFMGFKKEGVVKAETRRRF